MCAGAIFWGNVRRVVFALSEEDLRGIVSDKPAIATLAIPCREIFGRGDHTVEVCGPHLGGAGAGGARRFLGLSPARHRSVLTSLCWASPRARGYRLRA